ncbi:MAG: YggT family protein [Actinomycetota bacterium]|nr:YggT family protein [Actinomycetota bacterium]
MTVKSLLCDLVTVFMVVVFLRVILSWFPPPSGGAATFYRLLLDLTEPVLAPLRRVIPPIGMLDLSVTVLLLFLLIVRGQICA